MDFNINSFSKDYHRISKENVANLEAFDYYLLGDDHEPDHHECDHLNGAFIGQLASSHRVIVLLEGASMSQTDDLDTDFYFEKLNIAPHLREKIKFSGWDVDFNEHPSLQNTEEQFDTLHALEKEYPKYHQLLLKTKSEIKLKFPGFSGLPKEEIKNYLSKMKTEKYEELHQLLGKHQTAKDFLAKWSKAEMAVGKIIKASFLDRVHSMTETLRTIKQLQAQQQTRFKVVLVAGAVHLHPIQILKGKKEFDLTSFYQELNQLNAVILIPKIIDASTDNPQLKQFPELKK